ncbi:MAG: hypothetical protein U0235_13520 [Polyangiaceae bacterium]
MTAELTRWSAEQCWNEILHAFEAKDDRALWLAWKKYFPLRFWKVLEVPGVGALCRTAGIDYTEVLRRVTAYDLDPTRNRAADDAELRSASLG